MIFFAIFIICEYTLLSGGRCNHKIEAETKERTGGKRRKEQEERKEKKEEGKKEEGKKEEGKRERRSKRKLTTISKSIRAAC